MLDLWIIGIFLLITLIVGMWQGRGIQTFRSFAIADRNYSTGILVATIYATLIGGGSSLGVAEKSFMLGTFFYFIILGDILNKILEAKFVASNIDRFRDCISIGDIAQALYGKRAKIITGIAGTLSLITVLGAQIAAMGQIFHYFLDITPLTGIIVGTGIVIIYSLFGGIKAVTITDVIQFIILMISVTMICNVGLAKIGGYSNLMNSLPESHLNPLPPKGEFWKYFNMFLVFSIPTLHPGLLQRILMAKNGEQAKRSLIYSALIYIPFYKMVCIIGLIAFLIAPESNPVFALPGLVKSLLPVGLKGIAICGLLSIVMSTADSVVNVWSILIVHDVIKPLCKTELSDKTQLKLARFFTIVIGIWGALVAVQFKSLLDIILLARFFWKPIVVVGLFAGMAGFQAPKRSFYLGIIAGISTMLLSLNFNLEKYLRFNGTILAIFANALVFFSSSYYYRLFKPQSFSVIQKTKSDYSAQDISSLGNLLSKIFSGSIIPFLKWFSLKPLVEASNLKVKEWGAPPYQIFAVFAIFNYVIPFFIWSNERPFFWELTMMRLVAGSLCALLLLMSESKKKSKEYLAPYWYFTIWFCLPFMTSLVFYANDGTFWTVNIALSIFLLSMLIDWKSFCLFFASGFILSYYFFIYIFRGSPVKISLEQLSVALYILAFSLLIGFFFSRRREDLVEQRLNTLKALGGSIAHELRTPISALSIYGIGSAQLFNKLFASYKIAQEAGIDVVKLSNKEIQNLNIIPQNIQKITSETLLIIDMLLTKLKDSSKGSEKKHHSIKETIELAMELYPLQDSQRSIIHLNLKEDFIYYGNNTSINHIIFNLLKNSLYYLNVAGKGEIIITTAIGQNSNKLYFKDTGQGIKPEGLPYLFEKFYSKSNGGTGLGLAFCKMTMEELGGSISCQSVYGEYIEFTLDFPISSQIKP